MYSAGRFMLWMMGVEVMIVASLSICQMSQVHVGEMQFELS